MATKKKLSPAFRAQTKRLVNAVAEAKKIRTAAGTTTRTVKEYDMPWKQAMKHAFQKVDRKSRKK